MNTYDVRSLTQVRLSGRFDAAQEGFPMMWTGAAAQMMVRAGTLEAEIISDYSVLKPYLSFEVDGLRAQFFSPIKGTHWYSVFLGMDPTVAHRVRITLETQAFEADPDSYAALLRLRTDGGFEPLPAPNRKLEFIGDSITSGEGMRGGHDFTEWVPMCFCASDTYARLLADRVNAQYQVISQSGWGIVNSWDNDLRFNIPDVYDRICMPAAMERGYGHGGEKPYDFSFDPDAVIVNLGTNDAGSIHQEAKPHPQTGAPYRLTLERMPILEKKSLDFITHLHQVNPHARILWAFGVMASPECTLVGQAVRRAVEEAARQGIDAVYVPLRDMTEIPDGTGSRSHPGPGAHKDMADRLYAALNGD